MQQESHNLPRGGAGQQKPQVTMSVGEIGALLGVRRQRVHAIALARGWVPARPGRRGTGLGTLFKTADVVAEALRRIEHHNRESARIRSWLSAAQQEDRPIESSDFR